MLDETEKSPSDKVKDVAPAIAFWAGNLILALAEIRVYDFAANATGNWWMGVLSVFSTFLPFLVWEIMWQHKHAGFWMRSVALFGMALSFMLGLCVGTADYAIAAAAQASASTLDTVWIANALIMALAASMGVHGLGLLVYFYSHPSIAFQRRRAQALARMEHAQQSVLEAKTLCALAEQREQAIDALEGRYGKRRATRAIEDITGKKHSDGDSALAMWINDLFGKQTVTSPMEQPAQPSVRPYDDLEDTQPLQAVSRQVAANAKKARPPQA